MYHTSQRGPEAWKLATVTVHNWTTWARANASQIAGRAAAATTLAFALMVAAPVTVTAPSSAAPSRCTPAERTEGLRRDQQRVLERLRPFVTLRDFGDLARLAATLGYAPSVHGFVSYTGIGTAFVQTPRSMEIEAGIPVTSVSSGDPIGVTYQPGPGTTDPYTPRFPYRLAGWFYGGTYTPGLVPTSTPGWCLTPSDWIIHERGIHTLPNLDMLMLPPAEAWRGQMPGPTPLPILAGLPHPRLWDLHVWANYTTGIPTIQILSPLDNLHGKTGSAQMAFFYPDHTPSNR